MDKITEIRIEHVIDEENDQDYYWIYYYKNRKIKIIGKSSVKPQCYKLEARYLKLVDGLKINKNLSKGKPLKWKDIK